MTSISSRENKMGSFDAVTKKDWEEAAQREWGGSLPAEKTAPTTGDLVLSPYYDRSDLPSQHGSQLFASVQESLGARAWLNMPLLSGQRDREANETALSWLNAGADGILFDLQDMVDPKILLRDIELPHCSISFLAHPGQENFFSEFITMAKAKKYDPRSIVGTIFWKKPPARLGELAAQFENWSQFRPIGILADEEKKSPEDEIGDLLAKAVKQIDILVLTPPALKLRRAGPAPLQNGEGKREEKGTEKIPGKGKQGIEIKSALRSLAFSVTVGTDFFLEIAKLKTLRMLWHQIASSYLPKYSSTISIHAVSKPWTRSEYQPHGHLLKSTTAGLSAIIGGCDALTILSEDSSHPSMTRITRNISSILREESHISKVADPTAGSYYLENVIDRLAQDAWKKFQQQL